MKIQTYSSELDTLLQGKPFAASDRTIVDFLQEVFGEAEHWILLAAALCSAAVREGNSYLDLSRKPSELHTSLFEWPDLSHWRDILRASDCVGVEEHSTERPLIFQRPDSLYLNKYYEYEKLLANEILKRVSVDFVPAPSKDPVSKAIEQDFFVITGGPGTGKTTLALRYLNELLLRSQEPLPPRFAAIAPTGKAAARLSESIRSGLQKIDLEPERKKALSAIPCLTLHRLLKPLPHSAAFQHNPTNSVSYDALVIDEASMIDLPLMLKLLQAVPETCKILILGDKDQLSSVSVGTVLADILEASQVNGASLGHSVENLRKTYRFREDSSIYQACQLAKNGDSEGMLELLESEKEDFAFHQISSETLRPPSSLIRQTLQKHSELAEMPSAEIALSHLDDSIVLCPTRSGKLGSERINATVLELIRKRGAIPSGAQIHATPIIILENDYELGLFNGDLGISWHEHGCFLDPEGTLRSFPLNVLPRHEAAFALTIHKSQGSEFSEVVVLVGQDSNRLLTQELLYTAFSRARRKLTLYGDSETISKGLLRKVKRASGLAKRLGSLRNTDAEDIPSSDT